MSKGHLFAPLSWVKKKFSEIDNAIDEHNGKFVYSTDEQVIGTWIDGKTLYRRVLQGKSPSTANTGINIINVPEVNKMIRIDGLVGNSMRLDFYTKAEDFVHTWWRDNQKSIAMNVSSAYINYDVQIVIEYTK